MNTYEMMFLLEAGVSTEVLEAVTIATELNMVRVRTERKMRKAFEWLDSSHSDGNPTGHLLSEAYRMMGRPKPKVTKVG